VAAHGSGDLMLAEVTTDLDGRRLVLSGDVDCRSTARLRTALAELLESADPWSDEPGGDVVVVDLAAVECVDVTALKVLAAASCRAGATGRRVVLRAPGPAVRRLLHLTHLIRVVELEPLQVGA